MFTMKNTFTPLRRTFQQLLPHENFSSIGKPGVFRVQQPDTVKGNLTYEECTFSPAEITTSLSNNGILKIQAAHEENQSGSYASSTSFRKVVQLPKYLVNENLLDDVKVSLTDGIFTVNYPESENATIENYQRELFKDSVELPVRRV